MFEQELIVFEQIVNIQLEISTNLLNFIRNLANYLTFNDLSFASTETKFIKPKTKTQNNIVIFGFFHKKIILLFWLFLK